MMLRGSRSREDSVPDKMGSASYFVAHELLEYLVCVELLRCGPAHTAYHGHRQRVIGLSAQVVSRPGSADPSAPPPARAEERSGVSLLAPIVVGSALAVVLLLPFFQRTGLKADDLALGAFTTSVLGDSDGYAFHSRYGSEMATLVEAWRMRGASPIITWLGNSQLHGVNRYTEGESTAPMLVFDALRSDGVDTITISPPSSNLVEHYLLFEFVRSKLPLKGVVLQGLFLSQRWTRVRHELTAHLADDDLRQALEQTRIGRSILEQYSTADEAAQGGEDLSGLRDTWQEVAERALNGWLAEHWSVWRERPEARTAVLSDLRQFRLRLFRLDASRKRRMLPGPYRVNLDALETLFAVAQREGIKVVFYIVPLRPAEKMPYFQDEYDRWLEDVQSLCREYGVTYANLQNIVPLKYWGTHSKGGVVKKAQPDFWHFRAEGHEILARRIIELARKSILLEP